MMMQMQESGPNKPLLRIYKHLTKEPANHIWAAIKTDNSGDNTDQYDLGLASDGYWGFDVRLVDGNMIIDIDGEEKVDVDVSFWDFPSYWKAGVYLQNEGEATAHFAELYEGDGSPVNHSPSVTITGPANGEGFAAGSSITITADAYDTDGSISIVEFFQGNVKLGEDDAAPFELVWNDVEEGNYTLTAIAVDNDGASSGSLGVEISVGTVYHLAISTTGQGSVSTNPTGTEFSENSVVSLLATPSDGYVFEGWDGDLSGRQNPISITMDTDKTVIANFEAIPTYSLAVTVVGNGSIEVSPLADTYQEGTVVSLVAIPESDFQFAGWGGDISGTEEQINITMTNDLAVIATFGKILSVQENESSNTVYDLKVIPNPVDSQAIIEYQLPKGFTSLLLTFHDVSGKKVDELIITNTSPGKDQIEWFVPKGLKPGLYFLKLHNGEMSLNSRLLLNH